MKGWICDKLLAWVSDCNDDVIEQQMFAVSATYKQSLPTNSTTYTTFTKLAVSINISDHAALVQNGWKLPKWIEFKNACSAYMKAEEK